MPNQVDDVKKVEVYQHTPYPSFRFHKDLPAVEVTDADDEITKCGSICDTKDGKPNASGWKDTPYPPKPAPAAVGAVGGVGGDSGQAKFVAELYQKVQDHEARLDALENKNSGKK